MLFYNKYKKGGNHEINTPNKKCILDFDSSVSARISCKFCQRSFRIHLCVLVRRRWQRPALAGQCNERFLKNLKRHNA